MAYKILCVEDEIAIRDDLVAELTEQGFEVLAASDGAEALRLFDAFQPDLVVSDCMMPGMTGIEMLRALRSTHPHLDDLPFIFLSAHAQQAQVDAGLLGGASAYMTKPVDYDVLLRAIDHLIDAVPRAMDR